MATVFAKPEPRFGARLGAGGLEVVNLFAWRATDPAALHTVPDPVGGPLEDDRQMTITLEVDLIVKTYGSLT